MSRLEHFQSGIAVPDVQAGASRYAGRMGLAIDHARASGAVAYAPLGRRLAQEYEAAPDFDASALPHFKALREETARQFDHLTAPRSRGGMGIDVSVTEDDPYPDARSMISDLSSNRRISVLSTRSTGSHPFLTDDQNDMFRAVHDVFGHAGTGRGFDRHGEEAAFQAHRSMFSDMARPALATETRGQNSALNFGSNPGMFADQKVAILPSGLAVPPRIGRRGQFQASLAQARGFHERDFGPTSS